jgi:geranylgeranyl diphosphate synthase type II
MSGSKFTKIYEKQRTIIETRIHSVFSGLQPTSLYEPAAYISRSGGKRIRSILVQLSAKAVGGKFNDVYNAAVAIELFHNFTLVHDDIMDNADKRRNLVTIHRKYDVNTAILSGDGLIALAYQYLLKDCKSKNIDVIADFTQAMIEVCEGQSYDKDLENSAVFSLEDYLLMINKKTAILLETACKIGAKLGGGSKKQIDALSDYANNIGLAFQIQDDMLDLLGEEDEFGKKVGGDLLEGKKTYLIIKAIEIAKGENQQRLQKFVKNKGITEDEIPEFINMFRKLGVFETTQSQIIKYSQKAEESLKYIPESEAKAMLQWLIHQLIKRKN